MESKSVVFGSVQTFPPGVELFRQDEPAEVVYLIRDGAVKLVWADINGAEVIVGLRWPGWFLGAAAQIVSAPNPATAVTLVQSTVESISSRNFAQLIASDHEFTRLVHESHSREILESTRTMGEFGCLPARSRLKCLLSHLISSLRDSIRLHDGRLRLPLKHKELAALIGISPEHLSRVLRELAADHAIDLEEKWIIVRHPEKLMPVELLRPFHRQRS
jgi:CRP-like cAMP-binding protein